MEEVKQAENTPITIQQQIDILVNMGQYKRASKLADIIGLIIKIKDHSGTMYHVDSNGSVRRTIPKKRSKSK